MSHLKSLVTFFFIFIYALQADTPENLAKIRGNQNGLNMAEAFQIIRRIELS